MAVIVNLNDIFEGHEPDVLQKRIEYASERGSRNDFWEHFFFCEAHHPNDMVVYLFTEYQLKKLYDFWENMQVPNDMTDKEERANIQMCFNQGKTASPEKEAEFMAKRNVCFVKYEKQRKGIYKKSVEKLFFKPSPEVMEEKKHIKDFFAGGFIGIKEETNEGVEYHEIFDNLLALTRKDIKDLYGGPTDQEKFKGWLYYLAEELHKKDRFKFITFCKDVGYALKCPLVALLWPPSSPLTPAETDKQAS